MMIEKTENRLLFIDTETGGTNPQKHSLLSIGLAVWEKNKGILGSNEYFIKHDKYVITKEAQKINQFDEEKHNKESKIGKIVVSEINSFIANYFLPNYLVPLAGHNIQFDINFIKKFYQGLGVSFNKIYSHRALDTYSILRYLFYTGKIDKDISSSSKAFTYFNVKVSHRHSALCDVLATVELFEKMLELTKNGV